MPGCSAVWPCVSQRGHSSWAVLAGGPTGGPSGVCAPALESDRWAGGRRCSEAPRAGGTLSRAPRSLCLGSRNVSALVPGEEHGACLRADGDSAPSTHQRSGVSRDRGRWVPPQCHPKTCITHWAAHQVGGHPCPQRVWAVQAGPEAVQEAPHTHLHRPRQAFEGLRGQQSSPGRGPRGGLRGLAPEADRRWLEGVRGHTLRRPCGSTGAVSPPQAGPLQGCPGPRRHRVGYPQSEGLGP